MITPERTGAQESLHYYLARVLGLHGAIACAEDGSKIPIRWSDLDPDAVATWLQQRGGVGTTWEQYGVTHAALAPMPEAPAGFVLPPTCRLMCVDVDVDTERGLDGYADLAHLQSRFGELPATLVTVSPRGGLHLWFLLPIGCVVAGSGKIGGMRSIDCKGNGGAYVGEIGRGRGLLGGVAHEIAELPEVWVAALPRAGELRNVGALARDGSKDPDTAWLQHCQTAPAGARDTGLQVSLQVKLLGKEAGARDLKFEPALAVALEHYNPRCVPPFNPGDFARRFRAWFDPGEIVEAQRYVASVFADAFPEHAAAQEAQPEKGNSPLSLIAMPEGGTKPTTTRIAKYFAHHDAWRGRLRWDEFGLVVRAFDVDLGRGMLRGDALKDSDFALLRAWYTAVFREEPDKSALFDGVVQAAQEWSYHPVRDYLRQCRKRVSCSDDAARAHIDAACTQIFCREITPIEKVFFRKTLLAAVRRAFMPGEKVDTVLLLVGGQGAFKSTLLAELFGRQWFGDSYIDIRQKDAAINIAGKWCYELAELASVRRDELERVRSFVTSSHDRYRAPYGRVSEDHPRQGVLCGTSNEREVLHDPEGLRRWWPIGVECEISIPALRELRDSLWGCAMLLVDRGEPHYLDAEQEARATAHRMRYTSSDPWIEDVHRYLRGKTSVRSRDVLENACSVSPEGAGSQGAHRRLARLLRALGCDREHRRDGYCWTVPDEICGPVKAAPEFGRVLPFEASKE